MRVIGGSESRYDLSHFLELRALVEKPVRAGVHARATVAGTRKIGQDDDDHVGQLRADRAQHVERGSADQLEIQYHAGRARREYAVDRGDRTVGDADDADAVEAFQKIDEAVANGGRILDDEDIGSVLLDYDAKYRFARGDRGIGRR
jgi:hypothetical protein